VDSINESGLSPLLHAISASQQKLSWWREKSKENSMSKSSADITVTMNTATSHFLVPNSQTATCNPCYKAWAMLGTPAEKRIQTSLHTGGQASNLASANAESKV